MSDNVIADPGSGGATFATDDIGGVHYPYTKIVFGPADTATIVSTSAGLPVAQQGTWNIGTLTTITAVVHVDDNAGSLTVDNAGTFAVQVDGAALTALQLLDDVVATAGAAALTKGDQICGTDGTNARILKTDSGGELQVDVLTMPSVTIGALPAGTNNIGDVDVLSIVPGVGATNLGKAEDAVHASGDIGVFALTVRRDTASATADTDGDYAPFITDGSGRLHVAVGNTVTVTGTVTVAQATAGNLNCTEASAASIRTAVELIDDSVATIGSATPAKGLVAAGHDGTNARALKTDASGELQVDVLTLPNVTLGAGTNTNEVVGDAAHDAAVAGNPVLIGAEARDTLGTAVATGDSVRISADRYGRLHHVSPKISQASSNATAITSATDTTAVGAPAASNHLRIHRLHAVNSGATATWVYWRDGAAGTRRYPMYLPQNGMASIRLEGGWDLTTATLLGITTTAAGNVEWHVDYETVAD